MFEWGGDDIYSIKNNQPQVRNREGRAMELEVGNTGSIINLYCNKNRVCTIGRPKPQYLTVPPPVQSLRTSEKTQHGDTGEIKGWGDGAITHAFGIEARI